jgi:hypothetical protein
MLRKVMSTLPNGLPMEWKEIPLDKKWILEDNGDVAAAIFLVDKEKNRSRYQVKTILSAIYLGKKRFTRLEKKKCDWLATRKKFATPDLRIRYVEAKKKEILNYIKLRTS